MHTVSVFIMLFECPCEFNTFLLFYSGLAILLIDLTKFKLGFLLQFLAVLSLPLVLFYRLSSHPLMYSYSKKPDKDSVSDGQGEFSLNEEPVRLRALLFRLCTGYMTFQGCKVSNSSVSLD